MFRWISDIINSVANLSANFSKLNNVKTRAVVIFAAIAVIGVVTFFLVKLCMKEEVYNALLYMKPITLGFILLAIIFVIFIVAFVYKEVTQSNKQHELQKRQQDLVKAVIDAINNKEKEKAEKEEKIYKQTSKIEKEAREYTKTLIGNLNADVATVQMLHNKEVYDGGVHCRFYSESFPSTRDKIFYDARQYQRIQTNTAPIITYIEDEDYYFDTVKNLAKIDPNYAKELESMDTHHVALKFMTRRNGKPLGILTCAWREGLGEKLPKRSDIKDGMTEIASKLETVLDVES